MKCRGLERDFARAILEDCQVKCDTIFGW
jgi:hypothetical protein